MRLLIAVFAAAALGAAPTHAVAQADVRPAGAVPAALRDTAGAPASAPNDTAPPRRPRAVEYSDWYARRLAVHRAGSYAMLPLFAAEYALGDRLLSDRPQPGWVKPSHVGVALGLGALFTVNTVTGVWNLWDARHDPSDRTRKWLHSALLLASDAGFAYTGAIAGQATESSAGRTRHKNAALVSMGLSTAGTAMMWLWKR